MTIKKPAANFGKRCISHPFSLEISILPCIGQSPINTTNANRSWDGVYNMSLMTNSPAKTWVTSLGSGWYLPSIDELSLLWHNRFHANKGLNDAGATLLAFSAYYWSSTEYSLNGVYTFYFVNGEATGGNKSSSHSVRAIRAF